MRRKAQTILMLLIVLLIFMSVSACSNTPGDETYKIGVVNLAPPLEPILDGFKAGMEEAGYVEGENIIYIYDGPAPNPESLEGVIENLKNEEVDLVLTFGTLATTMAKEGLAGTDIPIIFGPVTDPVASGIVTSILNPGGNITGIQTGNPTPKRLEWLLKIDPEIKRLYVLHNPTDNSSLQGLMALTETAPEFDVELVVRDADTPDKINTEFNEMPDDIDAIFVLASAFLEGNIDQAIEVANERKLSLSAPSTANVRQGALTSFGHDNIPLGRQAARLALQILSGIKPAELPVESAELFLTINLGTAETIGLEISGAVLETADEIVR